MRGNELLADTNVLLYLLRGDDVVAEVLDGRTNHVSFITEIELLGRRGISFNERTVVADLLSWTRIIDLDPLIKSHVIELRSRVRVRIPDAIIAASSIVHDIPLFSADRDFEGIPGLDVIRYDPGPSRGSDVREPRMPYRAKL